MTNDLLDLATGIHPPALVVMSHWWVPRITSDPRWPQPLAPTISELDRAHVPVVFVLDVPNFATQDDGQATSCRGGLLNFSCVLPRQRVEAIQGRARMAEFAFTRKYPDLTTYDPWEQFCDAAVCSSVVGGRLAYWDFDHLNGIGGRLFTRDLQRVMQTAMQTSGGSGSGGEQ